MNSLGSTATTSSNTSRREGGATTDDGGSDQPDELDNEDDDKSSTMVPRVGPPVDSPASQVHRNDGLRKQSSYKNENPWNRPRTGKKLSFVDEKDSAVPLHEITYSKFTHYSRAAQATVGAAPPAPGCCTIQ